MIVEIDAEVCRLAIQKVRKVIERVDVLGLDAEREIGHDAGCGKRHDGALRKALRARHGKRGRDLGDDVGAAHDRPFGTGVFIGAGRLAALHEVAGHRDDAEVRARLFFGFLHVVDVPVVQRIVFRNDADHTHGRQLPSEQNFFHFKYTIFCTDMLE